MSRSQIFTVMPNELTKKLFNSLQIALWLMLLVMWAQPAPTVYAAPASNAANTCDLAIEIIAAPYAVVDSNMPGVQGPQVAMVGARVTNRGAVTQENLYVHLGDGTTPGKFLVSSGGSLALQAAQPATQRLNRLDAGQTETFYWAITYPPSINVSYPYTIWATTTSGCSSSQQNQIKTERQISANANKLLPTGAMVLVAPKVVTPGSLVTIKIIGFTLGTVGQGLTSTYDAWLQPVGNPDFDPSCLRFAQSKVLLRSISSTPFEDQLYFTNLKNYRQDPADYVEYSFVALRSCTTAIQPYQEAASGTQEKYNDDYAASFSRINVLCSSTTGLNVQPKPDKMVAAVGEKVHFQAQFATGTGQFGSPSSGSPAVITAPIPSTGSYINGSANSSAPATQEFSTDGGKSWQSTEPAPPALITHLRWLLHEPVTTAPQSVTYDVVVNTSQCWSGPITLGLLDAQALINANLNLNCAPTPTPTPAPTATPRPDTGVQSGGDGGLESGPLPGEPSAFTGGVGNEGAGANAAAAAAANLRWHKARLLNAMQIRLEDFVPSQGPAGTTPKAAVPIDVLAETNAPDAKAVDFVDAAGRVQAVALGILSVGGPYAHDYGVCNRFKEYVFDSVEPLQLALPNQQNGWFWHSHAVRDETRSEEALFFHIFVNEANKQFHIDSRWIQDDYPAQFDFAFDYVFNLQLWSNDLTKTQELLTGMLTKLGQIDNGAWQLIYHNQTMPTAATLFVKQTTYHADVVQLALWNRTTETQPVRLYGAWRSQTDRNTLQPFEYTLDLPADQTDLSLVFPGLLDATIYVESNGFTDKIYQGGGLWFSVKGAQNAAPTMTLGQCRQVRDIDTQDLVLAGCAEVTTAPLGTNDQIGIGRTLNPNGRSVDVSPYKALRFWAKGDGTPVRVILETAGVTDNDYYQTVFRPDGEWRQYMLPLTQFSRNMARTALAGTDVKAVIWTNAEATGRPMTLAVDGVSFTNQELLTIVQAPQDGAATTPRALQVETSDLSSVGSILAYYSMDRGITFQSVPLTQSNSRQQNAFFQGELPGAALGSDLIYYLETTYTNGYIGRTPLDAPVSYYRYRVDDRPSLLVNDFAGPALQNRLSLGNGIFNDPTAGGRLLTYHQDHQLVLDYDVSAEKQLAGYFTYLPSLNLTTYTTLDLLMRGDQGGEQVRIGLRNSQNVELFISVGDLLPGGLTTGWQWVQIPLSSFAPLMDLTDIESMSFFFTNSDGAPQGRLYVQEMRFTTLAAPLVIDNFDDRNMDANGQMMAYWSTAPNSTLTATTVDGDALKATGKALRLDYSLAAGGYTIWNTTLNRPKMAADGLLTLWVKGAPQAVQPNIYLASDTMRAKVALATYVTLTNNWQLVKIPLSAFATQGIDLNALTGIQVVFEHSQGSGTLWLDNIQLGAPGAPQADPRMVYLHNTDLQQLALHLPSGGQWWATSDVPWLVLPHTGAGSTTLAMNAVTWDLTPGVYTGHVTVRTADGQSETVTTQLTVIETAVPAQKIFLPLTTR